MGPEVPRPQAGLLLRLCGSSRRRAAGVPAGAALLKPHSADSAVREWAQRVLGTERQPPTFTGQ